MRTARRIENLPPYLFAELDRKVNAAKARGIDVISFGVGDPDRPTPSHIVEAAKRAVADPATHQYPSYYGMAEFRRAVAAHYERRFGVGLDPDTQVLPLIGSKEGISHLASAFVDPGDKVLVSDPGYPVYGLGTILSGGEIVPVPLREQDGYLPQFDGMEESKLAGAKVLWLNYPANPTSAVCELSTFEDAVAFCRKHDLLLAHDAAYSELTYDGFVAPSVLQAEGALDVAVEFGSLSKTYNMTGWRVGWCVGSARAVEALGRVKTNIDSGIFNALQVAGIAALEGPQDHLAEMKDLYRRRRDTVVSALNSAGWSLKPPLGAIYVWAPTPDGRTSAEFAEFLLDTAGVVVAPGAGYGANGEGYVRFSLTLADEKVEEGMARLASALESGTV